MIKEIQKQDLSAVFGDQTKDSSIVDLDKALSTFNYVLSSMSISCIVTNDLDTLSSEISNLNGGTIAIVSSLIADEYPNTIARTAYSLIKEDNGIDGHWEAFNGNYSVDNVFFDNDIKMAGDYINIGAISKGSKTAVTTFNSKGKSVKEVFTDIFLKDNDDANVSYPTLDTQIIVPENEVGTIVQPKYKLNISFGSYTYGSIDSEGTWIDGTGVTKNVLSVNDSLGFYNTNVEPGNEITSDKNYTLMDSSQQIVSGYYEWSDGNIPATMAHNKSKNIQPISNSNVTITANLNRGNRYGFYGYRTFDEGPIACFNEDGSPTKDITKFDRTKITSNDIRLSCHALTFVANDTYTNWPTSFIVKGGSQQIIFAVPHNSKDIDNHKYIKMSNIALGTYYFENDGLLYSDCNLSVNGINDYKGIAYDIWCINPSGKFESDTTYTISYGNTKQQ